MGEDRIVLVCVYNDFDGCVDFYKIEVSALDCEKLLACNGKELTSIPEINESDLTPLQTPFDASDVHMVISVYLM